MTALPCGVRLRPSDLKVAPAATQPQNPNSIAKASSITNVYRSWGRSPPAAIVEPGTIVRGGRNAVHEQVRPDLRNVTTMSRSDTNQP